ETVPTLLSALIVYPPCTMNMNRILRPYLTEFKADLFFIMDFAQAFYASGQNPSNCTTLSGIHQVIEIYIFAIQPLFITIHRSAGLTCFSSRAADVS
ncbi:MAG: hypothetical protein IJH95_05045, partial [Mogibacterium sp.]|nr:hypothetical protein [Mogibacterium sp.]